MRIASVLYEGDKVPCIIDSDSQLRNVKDIVAEWEAESLCYIANVKERFNNHYKKYPVLNRADCKFLSPVSPRQILCIGLNYKKHAIAADMPLPSEPIISSKSIGAVCGAYDDLLIPDNAKEVDWEVELGVVIGKPTHMLNSPEKSRQAILGYCVANDISDRHWLLKREGEWVKGKSFPSFCPLGPYVVLKDEIDNPQCLAIGCEVNGISRQLSNTSDMQFSVDYIVYYVSQFMQLFPGDVILTGSPEGISLGNNSIDFLKPGDIVKTSINGLGYQQQKCRRYQAP